MADERASRLSRLLNGDVGAAGSSGPSLLGSAEQYGDDQPLEALFTEPPLRDPAAPPAPAAPRYVIGELLGSGGMGEVFRVRDTLLSRDIAAKYITRGLHAHEQLRRRFEAEARVSARLQHPGVPAVHDLIKDPEGGLCLLMQEIRGQTLSKALPAGGAAGDPEALRRLVGVLHRVCETLAYAHSKGIVHRDIKPSNVMLGEHGEVLVIDWGLAAQVQPVAGEVSGTPTHMPPEQARGEALDARADVYAVGGVLYEILWGRPLLRGSKDELLRQLRAGLHSPTPGGPAPRSWSPSA
jgi:serine/threonine protein kinase